MPYDDIRFYTSEELQVALRSAVRHPMMKALLAYSLPDKSLKESQELALSCMSIDDFQREIVSNTVRRIIKDSSAGLTTSGFEKLEQDSPYLYISNHRDIVLDTCLLNLTLFKYNLIRTASAIGDNLVERPFINVLSKLTRNFIVKRGKSPRETLLSSKKLSEYIRQLVLIDNCSVWIAQRQGRTKDGNDQTEQGVLKMIALAAGDLPVETYLTRLKIVPISISYEYDPTDALKVNELLANLTHEQYQKSEDEDFNSIMKGALGQKKHIHLAAGFPIVVDDLPDQSINQVLKRITDYLDLSIRDNYRLWPTNYIAYDLKHQSRRYKDCYTQHDRQQFERRLGLRVDRNDKAAVDGFLDIYARPVENKLELKAVHEA
ncbi:MAG: 1-acyl-sn-glycerol-3-phosphate acyltransferase [Nonlabens sp.]